MSSKTAGKILFWAVKTRKGAPRWLETDGKPSWLDPNNDWGSKEERRLWQSRKEAIEACNTLTDYGVLVRVMLEIEVSP